MTSGFGGGYAPMSPRISSPARDGPGIALKSFLQCVQKTKTMEAAVNDFLIDCLLAKASFPLVEYVAQSELIRR